MDGFRKGTAVNVVQNRQRPENRAEEYGRNTNRKRFELHGNCPCLITRANADSYEARLVVTSPAFHVRDVGTDFVINELV
jgi:hypothetical protein